ncbi:hypothetical protein BEN71_12590 [Acinetobacter wuhouensis]|uniref:hypothetical protein n=1 Tax=Acinetobacter wuhouensis TaxID=1879050 RepID=UPI000E32E4CE|nr:hypothetical protein [Acinetobacter wuhouensis]AXQ22863.1 hypothetical protein BEN71_12590 [Acinetobacter wuhouensis]
MNEINKQQSRGYGSERALIPEKVDTPWVPPSLPDWVVDGAAGWGDTVSFGATSKVRDWMGTNDVVDKESNAYSGGQIVGVANMGVLGRAAVFKAGGATSLITGTGATARSYMAGQAMLTGGGIGLAMEVGKNSYKFKCVNNLPYFNANKILAGSAIASLYSAPMTVMAGGSSHKVAKEALDNSLVWYEKVVVGQAVSQPSGAIIDKMQDKNEDNNK